MTNMKKWNYVVAAFMAALGALVIAFSSKFPIKLGTGDPGAGFWPTLLGVILIALSVLLAVSTLRNKAREEGKSFALTLPGNLLVYQFMALTVGFCAAMYFLGLLIAAFIFLPIAMYMLGARGKIVFIIDIIFVVMLYVVFVRILHTPLPEPFWLH